MRPDRRLLARAGIALIYLALWQAASMLVGKELLLPGPAAVLTRFAALLVRGRSWLAAGATLARILTGYVLGVAAGAGLACVCARFAFAEALFSPLRGIVKATPVTSFILLAWLWFSSSVTPLFISFLIVLPIVWSAVFAAIRDTDPLLLEMARAFGFGRLKTARHVYLPSVLPQLLAAAATSLGFAWKSGVAAEIIVQPQRSIGYWLYQSKLTLETADLFAWTLMIVLLSMALEALLLRLIGKGRWHDRA